MTFEVKDPEVVTFLATVTVKKRSLKGGGPKCRKIRITIATCFSWISFHSDNFGPHVSFFRTVQTTRI